jgi:hypothetical protein
MIRVILLIRGQRLYAEFPDTLLGEHKKDEYFSLSARRSLLIWTENDGEGRRVNYGSKLFPSGTI